MACDFNFLVKVKYVLKSQAVTYTAEVQDRYVVTAGH